MLCISFVFKQCRFKQYTYQYCLKLCCLLPNTFLGIFLAIFILAFSSLSTNVLAADKQHELLTGTAMRYLASACANCHGTQGLSIGNVMPSLAGLNADYIREQMHLFQSGKREATVMHQLANAYSDAEINDLAAYFSAQSMDHKP